LSGGGTSGHCEAEAGYALALLSKTNKGFAFRDPNLEQGKLRNPKSYKLSTISSKEELQNIQQQQKKIIKNPNQIDTIKK